MNEMLYYIIFGIVYYLIMIAGIVIYVKQKRGISSE